MFQTCTETVSILYAVIFGAGEACVDLSTGSLIAAFAVFMLLVVIAQFAARKLWALVTREKMTAELPDAEIMPVQDGAQKSQGSDYESPIKTSRF